MLSCDTSPCDLSPERIPEKYGRPVKSAIQFYLLLSTYLCCISFLYLDLYVLGDDALIS